MRKSRFTEEQMVKIVRRRHYNEVRPHSAVGYLTPAQYVRKQSGNDGEAIRLK